MRMWFCDPRILCQKHLNGEHNEMHMTEGSIRRVTSLRKYIVTGLLKPSILRLRHDQLAAEMERRLWNHNSPMPEQPRDQYAHLYGDGEINIFALDELLRRCEECRNRVRICPKCHSMAYRCQCNELKFKIVLRKENN